MHYFKLTYKTITNEWESHKKYQEEFLKAFELTIYDFTKIDEQLKEIYKHVEKEPIVRSYLEKYREQYFTTNLEFVLFQMFSYHHFHEFYPILKGSYNFSSIE